MNDPEELTMNSLTIRMATPSDTAAVNRLAALDSSPAPQGAVLVAEVGGQLWSAISLDDFELVADPFRPTGELQFLLVERARQIRRGERGRGHGGRLAHAFASVTGHGRPRPTARLVH
jgi:hypothetical protein